METGTADHAESEVTHLCAISRSRERQLPASIKTPEDAAAATAYLARSAVERFDGIVTNKDGKPLAVVRGFKGAVAQTNIHLGTLVGEIMRVPGAAHVWFSHNHPSGNPELSNADVVLGDTRWLTRYTVVASSPRASWPWATARATSAL